MSGAAFVPLLLALVCFLLLHSVPAAPALRGRLVALLGERFYLAAYSVVSLAALTWLIAEALAAPHVEIWPYHPALTWVPFVVMPVACILFVAGAVTPNPLSVAFRRDGFDPDHPGIVGVTRHPLLWAFVLWAGSHVVANGDLASLVLFGVFGIFALAGFRLADHRQRRKLGAERWRALTARAPTAPWAAGAAAWREVPLWAVVWGLVVWVLLILLHPLVIGVAAVPPTWPFY